MIDWSPVDLLPGLWVGALAAVLAAALRRWFDSVPVRVLAVFAAVLGILFGEVLFAGKVLLPLDNLRGRVPFTGLTPAEPHGNFLQGDLIELVGPSQVAVREAWDLGRWPLWNARVGAGMPLLADPQAQALQPLVRLGDLVPWMRAAGVTAALRVLTALVFTFLWLRRQEIGEGPALAGALAYGLGGFLLLWLGWPIANSAALLPLVLYAVTRLTDEGGRRDLLLLTLALSSLLLGGHPETILYSLGLGGIFLLVRARGRRPLVLRRAVAALGVAGAVAAPALLPALDLVPRSLRADRLASAPPEISRSFGESLALQWLPVAAPNAYGNSRYIHYWGRMNSNEDASGFVGTAALLAALLAVGARRRLPQEGLSLLLAALCLGGLGFSQRLLLPLSFCLAHLCACSLERFRRGEARRWPVLLTAAGIAGVLLWGYLAHPDPGDRLAAFRWGWLHWQMRFLVLATLVLLAAATWKRWRGIAVAAVVLPVTAELLLLHGPANPPMPRRLAFPSNEVTRFLQLGLQIAGTSGPSYRMAALGRDFPPNLPSLYVLRDVRVYNPMAPADYIHALEPILTGWSGEAPELGHPGHPLYARLGVLYILTAPGRELPPPLTLALADPAGWVWEVPDPRPLLFPFPGARGARVRIPRLEAQWITAHLTLRPGQGLRSSLYQDGGWRLLEDGAHRPTGREDGPFLAVALTAGERRIDLLYRPRGFLAGLLLAALGLTAGVLLLTPPPPVLSIIMLR